MTSYQDTDLVYVDTDNRVVLGLLQWTKNGNPQPLEKPAKEEKVPEKGKPRKRRQRKEYYPWGTYRTMKRLYRLEGKEKEIDKYQSFDEALQKATHEAFWD